ncbi:hypothetical protein [Saccharomonospora saliphila]|uniref:hypothetical protein n=1 Tax=Saccharomonospora saliphila TaxID=369829 RepID=UPI000382DBB5|nr:hypothetical protein [Saccharomonospora saliphila]
MPGVMRVAEEWTKAGFEGFSETGSATDAVRGVFGDGPLKSVGSFLGEGTVSGGGSWSFDPEQIQTVIAEWENLLEDFRKDALVLEAALRGVAMPPSEDEPTTGYLRSVISGLTSLREASGSFLSYASGFHQGLQRSKEEYEKRESANVEAMMGGEET